MVRASFRLSFGGPSLVDRDRLRTRGGFLHDALEKPQRRGLVPLRRDDRFQDLAFMVDSAPEIAELLPLTFTNA